MKKEQFEKMVKEEIVKELMGMSKREKYTKYIENMCKKAEDEIDKYNFVRIFGEPGENASNSTMATIVGMRLKELKEQLPTVYKLVPHLFGFKRDSSNAADAKTIMGNKEVWGIIPASFHAGLQSKLLTDKDMKSFVKNVIEYKKKDYLSSYVLNSNDEMVKILSALKGE